MGWKEVYELGDGDETDVEEQLSEQSLPEVNKGAALSVQQVQMASGKTKPPARFNEATLLSAMENPVKYMESRDKQAVKILGETGGLGTVATRADIIDKLFHSYLMELRGKEIYITSKGKQLLELVPEDLRKPELTADWEMKLSNIAKGKLRKETFLQEIKGYTVEIIDEIKGGTGTFRHDNMTNKKCPDCGKSMLAVNGKNARMLVCQDRECGHKEVFETAKRRAGEYCICRCIREVETVKTEMIVIILTIMCFGKNVNRYSQRES